MAKPKQVYVCTNCGFESPKWMGQCPSCHEWNCLEEREVQKTPAQAGARQGISRSVIAGALQPLSKVSLSGNERIRTRIPELDRVLGGGIVRDSISIIAAKPGAGKSTLLLQLAQQVASSGYPVLYVSGEESESQMRRRTCGSRATVGSSIKRICGLWISARAISKRRFIPPDKRRTLSFITSVSST